MLVSENKAIVHPGITALFIYMLLEELFYHQDSFLLLITDHKTENLVSKTDHVRHETGDKEAKNK